jgi:orotidine-5'-phosphate decarboxylase
MTYIEKLEQSARTVGNTTCMGLDPQLAQLPRESNDIRSDLNGFFQVLFRRMSLSGLIPSAFKPNIGYYQSLDRPRDEDFSGSLALVDVMDMVENFFPGIPVILDSKRGDIARSSLNYAMEAFDCWQADAVTVAPYMGSDSITPFASHVPGEKGIYILNRTSNPGGKDFQNLMVSANGSTAPLYMEVSRKIASLNEEFEGLGAVVGATNMAELTKIATYYADKKIPLLIPGVGSQGGSASEVMAVLHDVGYPVKLARINSSSALTHPWKKGSAPENWLELCVSNLRTMIEETAL